jgi:sterol 24-C-methyltransferase
VWEWGLSRVCESGELSGGGQPVSSLVAIVYLLNTNQTLERNKSEMDALKKINVDELVNKTTKIVEQNPVAVGVSAALTVLAGALVYRRNELTRDGKDFDSGLSGSLRILNNTDHTLQGEEFSSSIADYETMFSGAREQTGAITSEESIEVRRERYAAMINHFYNLVTDFYEWGWCQSFHFGPRWHNETFLESIKRAEYYLCLRLGLVEGMKALDVGCGVGGPMRNMAIFTGANIEGITINQYQVNIGNKYNAANGLEDRCKLVRGDFQNLPFPDQYFDRAYAIEATCHSPDRVQTFAGVGRTLKTGGLFAILDWVMLEGKYNPNNKDHVRIKEGIEVGNGLPTLALPSEIIAAFESAGFEVLDHFDLNRNVHASNQIPWYDTLAGKMSLSGFRMTHIGRMFTHSIVWTLETLRIAPAGSTRVSALLNATALDLVDGGKD